MDLGGPHHHFLYPISRIYSARESRSSSLSRYFIDHERTKNFARYFKKSPDLKPLTCVCKFRVCQQAELLPKLSQIGDSLVCKSGMCGALFSSKKCWSSFGGKHAGGWQNFFIDAVKILSLNVWNYPLIVLLDKEIIPDFHVKDQT